MGTGEWQNYGTIIWTFSDRRLIQNRNWSNLFHRWGCILIFEASWLAMARSRCRVRRQKRKIGDAYLCGWQIDTLRYESHTALIAIMIWAVSPQCWPTMHGASPFWRLWLWTCHRRGRRPDCSNAQAVITSQINDRSSAGQIAPTNMYRKAWSLTLAMFWICNLPGAKLWVNRQRDEWKQ